MRFSRVVVTAAAATVAIPPVSAAAAPQPSPAQLAAQGRRTSVFVEGDSLTVGAANGLRRRLAPHVKRVGIDAQVGRFTSTGLSRVARASRAAHARVWVLALGTNDSPSPSRLRENVQRSLRMAGPDRDVVWLTIKRPGGYQRVNRELRRLDARYENLHVVDWAKSVNRDPGLIGGDRVHGTARGYEVRAQLIAEATVPLAQQRRPAARAK